MQIYLVLYASAFYPSSKSLSGEAWVDIMAFNVCGAKQIVFYDYSIGRIDQESGTPTCLVTRAMTLLF